MEQSRNKLLQLFVIDGSGRVIALYLHMFVLFLMQIRFLDVYYESEVRDNLMMEPCLLFVVVVE